ncbi:adenosylcobinamide amidohydrolase [Archangium violaceum]|uniref:adenosylcobinamide amidohydrolase n=1 Tax=Archangium violaceum TaxID=83451 RepID=UPI00193BAE48|nr:adenosylcobinamide amidohydrolase [Archangium violaceum]QRK06635.1 adenosylcobinamide amidohydrolase [Archangium violaceum]
MKAAVATPEVEAPSLEGGGRLLVVRFDRPHAVLSWAVINGGRRRARAVVWRQVRDDELVPGVDPVALLAASLGESSEETVGLLTSRDVSTFDDVRLASGALSARCVATVGLGNALAAGDEPGPLRSVGTINLLCQLSRPLSEGALVEAVALAAEARTAALMEARVPSRRSLRAATGTGTDCIVVAAPEGPGGETYVGKHTRLGSLLGGAVREATSRGIRRWLEERGVR